MEYTKCRRERPRAARGSGACDTRARNAGMAWSSRRVLRLRNRCGATVQRGWRGPYRSLHSLQDDSAKRRCRHGGRHDSELNTVTGSCSYEPNSTKALKSLVSYIAPLRMTRAGAVYGDAGPSAGSGTWQVCSAECRDARGRFAREGAKKKGPPKRFAQGA